MVSASGLLRYLVLSGMTDDSTADSRRFKHPPICPNCGADVPPHAHACPECGSDEQTGWSEDSALYDDLDLPDKDFDYGDFTAREFGKGPKRSGWKKLWWVVAIILLVLIAFGLLSSVLLLVRL